MAMPPVLGLVPPLNAGEIDRALHQALKDQQNTTPESEFCQQSIDKDWRYVCEEERVRYSSDDIETLRAGIWDHFYWKRDIYLWEELLLETIRDQIADGQYGSVVSTQDTAKGYWVLLSRLGYTAQDLGRERFVRIKDPWYWKAEAIVLRGETASRETEQREQHHKARSKSCGVARTKSARKSSKRPHSPRTPTKEQSGRVGPKANKLSREWTIGSRRSSRLNPRSSSATDSA